MDKRTCSVDGCDKPVLAKGLCNGHYQQRRTCQELRPLRSQLTLEQRFWQKVRKTESCWAWMATTTSKGYGYIGVGGRRRHAHRVSWEMTNGPIPDGMVLDHRCSNRKCVNPEHLRIVTNAQNLQHRTGANKNSASGIRGVSWDKRTNSWAVYVSLNGRSHWGGRHSTIDAADAAARALRAQLHTYDDHEQWVMGQAASPKNGEAA